MKLMRHGNSFSRLGVRRAVRCSSAAFTMIEIAIALAVIAFALVAIIGVLPVGMNVQKDNREETIINQDGPYWLEAIRNGAKGFDQLTNHVQRIGVVLMDLDTNTIVLSTNYAQYDEAFNKNGSNIVGLLSVPKWFLYSYAGSPVKYVVRIEAQVRGLTGSATEQGLANPDFAFSYLLVSEIFQPAIFSAFVNPGDSTNYLASVLPDEIIARSNNWVRVNATQAAFIRSAHDVRLRFQWPLVREGVPGPNRQNFRALAAGTLSSPETNNLHFFQSQNYVAQ